MSGAALLVGVYLSGDSERSFIGPLAAEQEIGIISIVFYLIGTIAGAWFIAPKAFYSARKLRPEYEPFDVALRLSGQLLSTNGLKRVR